jgi:DNA end-binding protein Ku
VPATRPIWKGELRLSLVSIPVEMFSATKSAGKSTFRQIHEPTGKPIHYEKVVDGVGPVDRDDIRKGYEYEKGDYVLLTDAEIDGVKLDTRKTLDLVQFVEEDEIPALYFDAPYLLVPTNELAEDAFRVVRDALRKTKRIGLGQLALRGKEYLVSVRPCGRGMLLETLHYDEEVRRPESMFGEISAKSADPDLLKVATQLIDNKTKPFDIKAFKDHYETALRELIAKKLKSKGRRVSTVEEDEAPKRGGNVIDLMSALKKSLESSDEAPAKPTRTSKRKAG